MKPFATAVMTESEYRVWWQLHRRAPVGEILDENDCLAYEDGLRYIHSEKTLFGQGVAAEQMNNRLTALEAEQARLEKMVSTLSTQLRKITRGLG